MAASVPCLTHPPFTIKTSSSHPSSPSLCNLSSHPVLGIQGVERGRVGHCNWSRAKCHLELRRNGGHPETDNMEQCPMAGRQGRNLLAQCFSNFSTKFSLASLLGAISATVELPAMAVTGVNDEEDLIWTLTQLGIVAFLYFIVAPPIIMNWLRIRWYKRNAFEMYLQFMFVFIFFPGVLLWAPFLNFRKFPRDPSLKYPWSVPENPTQVKNSYLKYPFAEPEDYE